MSVFKFIDKKEEKKWETTYIFIARWHAEECVRWLRKQGKDGTIDRLHNHYLVTEKERDN